MLVYICVRKLKHFQPHSLLCHLWCLLFAIRSFLYDIFIYKHFKSWRSSFDKLLFFLSYTIHITLLINCINTVTLAEQSLHHNIILEKLDYCWVNRIYVKKSIWGMSYDEIVSYITRNESIYLQSRFLVLIYFVFFRSLSCSIWSWLNPVHSRFLVLIYFFFFRSLSCSIWSWVNPVHSRFLVLIYFFFLPSFSCSIYTKLNQCICLVTFSNLSISFSFLYVHIIFEL